MTIDLDAALRRLTAIDDPRLLMIESAVLDRVREQRRADASFGAPFLAIAALFAVALGTTAGASSPTPVAAASLAPFGASNPLAPSTLLASDR